MRRAHEEPRHRAGVGRSARIAAFMSLGILLAAQARLIDPQQPRHRGIIISPKSPVVRSDVAGTFAAMRAMLLRIVRRWRAGCPLCLARQSAGARVRALGIPLVCFCFEVA
jgi:hypothetical protein